MIEGTTFHVKTDHKTIIGAMQRTIDRDLPRETRQLNFISIYSTDLRPLAGADNTLADALSQARRTHALFCHPLRQRGRETTT